MSVRSGWEVERYNQYLSARGPSDDDKRKEAERLLRSWLPDSDAPSAEESSQTRVIPGPVTLDFGGIRMPASNLSFQGASTGTRPFQMMTLPEVLVAAMINMLGGESIKLDTYDMGAAANLLQEKEIVFTWTRDPVSFSIGVKDRRK